MIINRKCPVSFMPVSRYEINGNQYERVSTIAHVLDDPYHLTRWDERMTIKGLAAAPELIVEAARTPLSRKAELSGIAERAREVAEQKTAAAIGTAIHADLEAAIKGERPATGIVEGLLKSLACYGLDVATWDDGAPMSEVRIIRPDMPEPAYESSGVAGTADLFLTDRSGHVVVADLKTGSNPLRFGHHSISAQLALYAGATDAVRDGVRVKMPMITGARGIVFHVKPDGSQPRLSQVDLRHGQEVIRLAMAVRALRAEKSRFTKIADTFTGLQVSVWDQIENCRTVGDVQFLKATMGEAWLPDHQEYARKLYDSGRIV